MIDWQILKKGQENIAEQGWYFPSFEVQEYLLAVNALGFTAIDQYGDTKFQVEDCKKLIENINLFLNSEAFIDNATIQFESRSKKTITINTAKIITCLKSLKEASSQAISFNGELVFFGD